MLPANLGDDLQVCPYDATHMIQKKSFQRHIIKCRENFKNAKKVTCRFDKTHIVPEQELHHHLSICPSRSVMDRELQLLASDGSALTGAVQAPEIRNHLEDLDEDWDSERLFRPTNALFNKKELAFEQVEETKKKYLPPGANYVPTPVNSELSILEFAKKNMKKDPNSLERGVGCGRGVPSVQPLPKFNYLGRGISRFDGPQTPGMLTVQHGQSQLPASVQSRPTPPPGFVVPEQSNSGQTVALELAPHPNSGQTVALEVAPSGKSFIDAVEEELKKLNHRQEEEKKELHRRHREERARLMLSFQNGFH